MNLHEAPEDFSQVVYHDLDKHLQVRLTVTTFRGVEYLSLRKYYLDFDEEWKPTPEGVNIPLSIESSILLFDGLSSILSQAESREVIEEYFGDIIKKVYSK